MTMKVSIVSAAAQAGTGAQDFSDSGTFGGDTPKLAIFLSAGAGAVDTALDGAAFTFGATDGTNQAAIAFISDTSTNPNNAAGSNRSDSAYTRVNSAGTSTAKATGSLAANKATLTWSDASESETIYALLIGGQVEASVVHLTSNNGTSAQSVTHGLSAAPDLIIAFGVFAADDTDGGGNFAPGIGFWTAAAEVGYSRRITDNLATSALAARISSTTALNAIGIGVTFTYTADISNVGASAFDITFSLSTTNRVHFICLRSTSGTALDVKAGSATAKTTTGTQADVSGMTLDPQVLLVLPTLLTADDTGSSADPGGHFGLGIACKRSSDGVTQYASAVSCGDDGTGTDTDWLNQHHSAGKHLHQVDVTGATAIAATVSSWSGGVEHNYGTASGAAIKFPYLAFGADVVASGHPAARRLGRNIIGVEGVRIH